MEIKQSPRSILPLHTRLFLRLVVRPLSQAPSWSSNCLHELITLAVLSCFLVTPGGLDIQQALGLATTDRCVKEPLYNIGLLYRRRAVMKSSLVSCNDVTHEGMQGKTH